MRKRSNTLVYLWRRVGGTLSCIALSTCYLVNLHWRRLAPSPATWPRGVTVSTLDSESSDRGSNPREASLRDVLANLFGYGLHDWGR